MKFSLVTTCWNEMRSLPRWRKDIEAQARQPDEVVVVDNLSTDGTQEFLSQWAGENVALRIIETKCGAAQGRNLAIREAAFEHIISTDMGVTIDPHWFQEITRPFEEDETVEVVAGNYCIDKNSVKSAAARAEYYLEAGGYAQFGPDFVVSNRSVGYLKRVWRELDGLPEDLTLYGDDSVFGRQILKAGFKEAFASKAMVYWSRPARLRQFWKECLKYGQGDGEAEIKKPWSVRAFESKCVPAWAAVILNGLRFMHVQITPSAVWRAISARDVAALCLMPALTFGRGTNYAHGYIEGLRRGKLKQLACRQRLTAQFKI